MNILDRYTPELNCLPEKWWTKYSANNPLIFLFRHGCILTDDKKRYIGHTDIPLSPKGMAQALYWKNALKGMPVDRIYSSRLKRCIKTARLIGGNRNISLTGALNEIDMGSWENRSFDDIKNEYTGLFEIRGKSPAAFSPPGGESFLDVKTRVLPFFNRISSGQTTLVVTHAGVIRVLLTQLLNMDLNHLFKIRIGYGELLVLEKS